MWKIIKKVMKGNAVPQKRRKMKGRNIEEEQEDREEGRKGKER